MVKMTKEQARYLGGKAAGKKLKEKSLKEYYENPAICQHCGKAIEVREGQRPCEVKIKKFCDRSCRTSFNNSGQDRHEKKRRKNPYKGPRDTKNPTEPCERCGVPVKQTVFTKQCKRSSQVFGRKRFCDNCL